MDTTSVWRATAPETGLAMLQSDAATDVLIALRAGAVSHRWSAQNYRSADDLPSIGRDASGCHVATGFATDGLTWGTVSAQIIAEQIMGRSPAFGEVCRPTRFSPVKGAKALLEETSPR